MAHIIGTPDPDALLGTLNPDLIEGRGGSDSLAGGDGEDTLLGGDGSDTLQGDAGDDSLVGGVGDDVYYVDSNLDIVRELSGQGIETVHSRAVQFTLANNVEHLALIGSGYQAGTGNGVANRLTGQGGDNLLAGLGGNDTLFGEGGNDSLKGGVGSDSLVGGTGDDSYWVNVATDVVLELDDQGTDTVYAAVLACTLGANLEHLTLVGFGSQQGTGNGLANLMTGQNEANLLKGLTGNDTLLGEAGNDTLDGGAGNDSLAGGSGDDTYRVNVSTDQLTEWFGAGIDTVESSASRFTLPDHVENLLNSRSSGTQTGKGNALGNVMTGASANDNLQGFGGDDSLTGNEGSDTLLGGADNDTLAGGDGSDSLGGGAGNDSLQAGDGDDTLAGGGGVDSLEGGSGDDRYLNVTAALRLHELAGGGYDRVYASTNFTLGDNFEHLELSGTTALNGTGNTLDNVLIGNANDNTLSGLGGADSIQGGQGNDTVYGGAGNDTLEGGAGDDTYHADATGDSIVEFAAQGYDIVFATATYTLSDNVEYLHLGWATGNVDGTGNDQKNTIEGNDSDNRMYGMAGNDLLVGYAGNDTLDGGAGTDTLLGGAGDDTYHVDATEDHISESGGSGYDSVFASVSFTLPDGVEYLSLASATGNVDGVGNISSNTIIGNGYDNQLSGGDVDSDSDTLFGMAGNDILWGGVEADYLSGGDGNDALYGSYSADELHGGAGNDTLDGGTYGGATVDYFYFETPLNASTNMDRVYSDEFDQFRLDNDIFGALRSFHGMRTGQLDQNYWHEGPGLTGNGASANSGLWYNTTTGQLYYNPTDNIEGDSVLFARITGAPYLGYEDFFLIE